MNKPFGEVLKRMNYLLNEAPQNEFSEHFQEFKELYSCLESIIITNKGIKF